MGRHLQLVRIAAHHIREIGRLRLLEPHGREPKSND